MKLTWHLPRDNPFEDNVLELTVEWRDRSGAMRHDTVICYVAMDEQRDWLVVTHEYLGPDGQPQSTFSPPTSVIEEED